MNSANGEAANIERWAASSAPPVLHDGETHVWAFDLDVAQSYVRDFEATLSRDEIARADRLRMPRDRDRFIVRRGQLRAILGRYAKLAPVALSFVRAPNGKSSLAPDMALERLRYNASGSASLGVLAVRLGVDVGIDVEQVRPLSDGLALAERVLSAREQIECNALPDAMRLQRFFEYWTRKEALVKVSGQGLGDTFDRLDLAPWSGLHAQRVTVPHDGADQALWVRSLASPSDGFVLGLAAEAPVDEVTCRTFNPMHVDR